MAMPRGPASVPLQPATLNMAKDGTQKVAVEASSLTQWIKNALLTQRYYWPLAVLTLAFEAVLTLFIVKKIPYTEIDFSTYMQQVHVFLSKGERDYTKITGDTGPCVYPAGHLYVYAVISKFSAGGVELRSVQYAFAALYLFSQAVMFAVYYYAEAPPILLPFLTLSKRLHSIYVLRLFNDGIAMTVMWLAILLISRRNFTPGVILTSLALGVKMNIFLFLPGLAVVLFRSQVFFDNVLSLVLFVNVQVLLSVPFITQYPRQYISSAFNLGRQFLYKWTVNLRFLDEDVFLDTKLKNALLLLHASLLAAFGLFRWTAVGRQGVTAIKAHIKSRDQMTSREITLILMTSNLIGILAARSLHYQFYSWYAQTIPLLVWNARLPLALKLVIPPALEYSWNVFPSTPLSSALLCMGNAALVWGMWRAKWV